MSELFASRRGPCEWDTFFGPPVLLGEGVGSARPWRGANPTSPSRSAEERRLLDAQLADLMARSQQDEHDQIVLERLASQDRRNLREQQQQQFSSFQGVVRMESKEAGGIGSAPQERLARDDDVELVAMPKSGPTAVLPAVNSDDDLLSDRKLLSDEGRSVQAMQPLDYL
jgi:hypothetical protein